MAFPKAFVTRFFQLISSRQLTEAQRELQRLKEKMQKTKWDYGYYRALHGMLLTSKANGNQYSFLSATNLDGRAELEQHREEFGKHVQNRFHDDFDRGFFSAWFDYMRLLVETLSESQAEESLGEQTSLVQYADSTRETL